MTPKDSSPSVKIVTATSHIITIFLLCSSFPLLSYGKELEGPNVCEREEEFPVVVQVKTQVPYQYKDYEWCARFPPRCAVYKTGYKTEYKDETKLTKKMIQVCCEGFAEVEGKCVIHLIHSPPEKLPRSEDHDPEMFSKRDNIIGQAATVSSGSSPSSSIGIWVGTCLSLLLVIAFFMILLLKYKKKLHQVKEELNYVTYTAGSDRGSSVGGNMENAIYATVNPSDASIPNNSVRNFVVNDLKSNNDSFLSTASASASVLNRSVVSTTSHPEKNSNVERAALLKKEAALSDEVQGATGGTDAGYNSLSGGKPINPNLYQTIQGKDAKGIESKEPIYEEVRELPIRGPVNDLSGQSIYDRPRTSQLNIQAPSSSKQSTAPYRTSQGTSKVSSSPLGASGVMHNDLSDSSDDVNMLDAVPKPNTAPKAQIEETSFVSLDMDIEQQDNDVIYTVDSNARQVED